MRSIKTTGCTYCFGKIENKPILQKPKNILEDLLHFYFSETIALFPQSARKNLYGATPMERISNVLKYFGRSIKEALSPTLHDPTELKDKVWLYLIGDNNYNSLHFLENKVGASVYVTPYRYQKEGVQIFQLQHCSRLRHLISGLPAFFKLFFSGRKEVDRSWDAAFRASGMYEYSLAILQKYQPKAIVFSNDTTLEPRALMHAAKTLQIPTFYIQHACVREDFPPLKFTCSFLEGKDALNKYQQSGPIDGDVKLIGVPKIGPYLSRKNSSKTVKRIGICSNLLDDLNKVVPVVNSLLQQFPDCKITYRPHPGDNRSVSFDSSILQFSNSREENPYEFLLKQDLIIAGNTSIHYEAAMLNVVSVYYQFDFNNKLNDTYGFVKNGLVKEANTLEGLKKIVDFNILQKRNMGTKAKYYNALWGTEDEGKSIKLVISFICSFLEKE